MPEYLPYPKEKDTKSRKARKGMRTKTFTTNMVAGRKLCKARKAERDARAEAAAEVVEETEE